MAHPRAILRDCPCFQLLTWTWRKEFIQLLFFHLLAVHLGLNLTFRPFFLLNTSTVHWVVFRIFLAYYKTVPAHSLRYFDYTLLLIGMLERLSLNDSIFPVWKVPYFDSPSSTVCLSNHFYQLPVFIMQMNFLLLFILILHKPATIQKMNTSRADVPDVYTNNFSWSPR